MDDRELIARAIMDADQRQRRQFGDDSMEDALALGQADAVLAALDGRLIPELPENLVYVYVEQDENGNYAKIVVDDDSADEGTTAICGTGPTIAAAIRDAVGEAEADDA